LTGLSHRAFPRRGHLARRRCHLRVCADPWPRYPGGDRPVRAASRPGSGESGTRSA